MDTKRDDLTGKEIAIDKAYKLKIVQPSKLTMEIDCEFSEQIKNLVTLAAGNGQRWFKWVKDEKGALHKQYPDEMGGM